VNGDEDGEAFTHRIHRHVGRVREFLSKDLWEALPAPRSRRWLYQVLRMGVLTWDGLVKTDVFTLSAALTFKVTFSLVPFLAVILAFFKGFGGLSSVADKVQDLIIKKGIGTLGDGIAEKFKEFIDNVNAAAIGVVGFVVLLYTSLSLLDTIEKTFNKIWGIKTPRALLRRFTVYWTILTVSPVALGATVAMKTFVESNRLYTWLNQNVPFFGKAVLILTPFLFAWFFFTLVYVIIPNTRVKPLAAFTGAIVAGTLWNAMTGVYVWYNAKVLTNYTFYGSLGSIPIFLLWIYLSWIVVLFGAEIAFAAQHVETYRSELEGVKLSPGDRDRLALVICVEAAGPFEAGGVPPTAETIATRLKAPSRVVHEVAYQLMSKGILREVTALDAKDPGLIPARDPSVLTIRDILAAMRSYGDPFILPDGPASLPIYRLVNEAEATATEPLSKVTLKELVAKVGSPPPAGPQPPAPAA
jgi:membrane protein